ncbi:MAG: septum formation initiator family protein [Bacilli bacterium]|nr:septum formation initiator family protein [Bacilli bacterium]
MAKKQKVKNRMRIIIPIVLFCLLLLIYKIGYYTYKIVTLDNNLEELTLVLDNLKKEENNLKVEIIKLQDDDYLARYAREKYKYTKDNELVLSIKNNNEIEEVNKDITKYIVIIVSLSIIVTFSIFIILIRKNSITK